ncbi:MAG: TonB-dependent receptor plug domain-containing protein, partial [Flavobacteriales bacterium]|nr:TonB-dependent receptor plug domain-containing protein [Flavobacteriales bacterium]
MQKTAILWLLFVLHFTANAQQIVVRNPNTNKPIEGASITGIPNRVWTFTDHRGRADISRFDTTSAIEITALGFAPLRTTYGQLALSSEVYLKPTSIEINEYVVRAADNSQRVYTSKMDRLGAPAFTFYMPSNAADLLGISGSVFVQKSQQGGGSPMMRGFSANRLLYVVDGVRMNNAIFRSGNLHNVISLDPFATAFVEVLPGPHAVMYGSDALGGVMRFESLLLLPPDSGFETTGNASFRYASANREGSVNGQVIGNGRHFGFATSLSRYEYGDLRMGSSGPSEFLNTTYVKPTDYGDIEVANSDPRLQTGTGYSQLNLFQKFRFSPHPKLDVFL